MHQRQHMQLHLYVPGNDLDWPYLPQMMRWLQES